MLSDINFIGHKKVYRPSYKGSGIINYKDFQNKKLYERRCRELKKDLLDERS
jgi:hypothetical protein